MAEVTGRVSDATAPWRTEAYEAINLGLLAYSIHLFEDRNHLTSKVFIEGFEGCIESSFTKTA
jgi:hypothetical protein